MRLVSELSRASKREVLPISAISGAGLEVLKREIVKVVKLVINCK